MLAHARMVLWLITIAMVGGVLGACAFTSKHATPFIRIEKISGSPDGELGYASGVSACYAGTIGDILIMGGGCNFPDIPAFQGGTKRFYKGIYVAPSAHDTALKWRKMGELPVESAYGVTISLPHRLILVGGSNSGGGLSATYSLTLSATGDALTLDTLPSLPHTFDNMAGGALGDRIYILGGNKSGKPSTSMFSLDVSNPMAGWTEETSFPGAPRVQPVCAVQDGALYVWGGFVPALVGGNEAIVATDGYRYQPKDRSWEPVSSPVVAETESYFITLTGGTAIALSDSLIVCAGGVHKDIFLDAISGRYNRVDQARYLMQSVSWYQFNDRLMVYNTRRDSWEEWGQSARLARAGAALLGTQHGLYLIGGETKPGIRTTEVGRIMIKKIHH